MRPLTVLMMGTALVLMGCGDAQDTAENVASSAASTAPDEDTAEASVRHIMEGVKNGQPIVAWNALPGGYQKDVNELVQTFGTNMDPDVWKQVTAVLQSVHQLLVDKQQFVVNHPAIKDGEDPEAAKQGVVQVTGLLKTILDGAGDLESLKTFDGGQFMQTTGADVVGQLSSLAKLAPKDGSVRVSLFEDAKVETVSSTDSTATLKLTGPKGDEQLQEFVKHDGKWLPKDMVEDWDQQMADAREGLKQLPEQTAQLKGQAMMMGGMVMGMLSPLQSAQTQEQFNQAAGSLMSSAGMFMGGMGGPGAGFGGAEPFEADSPDESLSDSLSKPEPEKEPAPAK